MALRSDASPERQRGNAGAWAAAGSPRDRRCRRFRVGIPRLAPGGFRGRIAFIGVHRSRGKPAGAMDGARGRAEASLRACFRLRDGRLDAGHRMLGDLGSPRMRQARRGHGWPGGRYV